MKNTTETCAARPDLMASFTMILNSLNISFQVGLLQTLRVPQFPVEKTSPSYIATTQAVN